MNLTKLAASLTLLVTLVAAGYFFFLLYDDKVNLHSEIAALRCANSNIDCDNIHRPGDYYAAGGIAVVGLITSLALFGAAQRSTSAKASGETG